MTFHVIRLIAIFVELALESDISDFVIIIYDADGIEDIKMMKWKEIPDCFNCKVNSFNFDFESKRIYIKSEVVDDE